MTLSTPKPTNEEKMLLQKAAELEPLMSAGWQSFRNFEDGRTEIMVIGDAGLDARPILLLTEDISYSDREFVIRAPQMLKAALSALRYVKDLAKRQDEEIRSLKGDPVPGKTKSKPVSQWCDDCCRSSQFQHFLRDMHGADISDLERIRSRVRTMLNVKSRSELDASPEAAKRWKNLWADFQAWQKNNPSNQRSRA
jgi:hypothetical protein